MQLYVERHGYGDNHDVGREAVVSAIKNQVKVPPPSLPVGLFFVLFFYRYNWYFFHVLLTQRSH